VRDAGEQEGAASPRRKLALPRALVRMQAGAEGCGNWYGAACLGDESGVRCGEGGLVSSCAENPRWQPGDYLMASAAVGERMARAVVSSRAFISLIHETIKCSTSFFQSPTRVFCACICMAPTTASMPPVPAILVLFFAREIARLCRAPHLQICRSVFEYSRPASMALIEHGD
jgi:hypothetical protein